MFDHSRLLQEILNRSSEFPQKVALIVDEEKTTYEQLTDDLMRVAGYMCQMGLKPKDRVAIAAESRRDFILFYLAAHLLGFSCVVVDAESNPQRLSYMMNATQPVHLFGFGLDPFPSSEYPDIDSLPVINKGNLSITSVTPSDESDILFTTGTTGFPKGVVLSHKNIFAAVEKINRFIGNTSQDIEAIGLPLCHSFGLGRLRCALTQGQTVVLLNGFVHLKKVFAAFEEYSVTGFGMVPSIWAYIEKFSGARISRFASQLRYIEIGSAPMPIQTKRKLCELFPTTRLCMHYGLTEASRSLFIEFHDNLDHLNSIGQPTFNDVSVKICNSLGNELPTGETGELCIKGDFTTELPYLNESTRDSFFGDYFRSGDLGYQDKEGFLYLTGRSKEMINVGGKKVSPMEVEEAICHLGGSDAICVGVPDPNGILGEVVKAYVLHNGTSATLNEIKLGLRRVLESYKIPVFIEWIDQIPKTASGKKQRLSLKE